MRSTTAAWVTIQIGCDNSCAFCIVPSVRGREVSRRMGDIVHEVETLAADGVSEITLLGQNVNSYGRDLGAGQYRPEFADLLRAVDAIDGIERIRFTSPHPKDLRPETIAAMAECRSVCEHLHLPLQSGSDRTLARMHRGYTATRYLERLAAARATIRDLAVTTDIIVGFPGETDDDFAATLDVVEEAEYDAAYTFVFSPRPGTEAADMVDDFVPAEIVQRTDAAAHRSRRTQRSGTARGACRHGRRSAARRPVEEGSLGVVGPHPPQQARARRAAAEGGFRAGEYVDVRVTRCRAALAAGRARAAACARPAPRRVRIPVSVSPA